MKNLVIIIPILLFQTLVFSQSKWLNKAETQMEAHNYYKAVKFLKKAYEDESDPNEKLLVSKKLAECYLFMNNYNEALPYVEEVYNKDDANPENILLYSDVLAKSGNLSKALQVIQKGKKDGVSNTVLEKKLVMLKKYQVEKEQDSHAHIKRLEEINSAYSDYSPAWFIDGKLVFSSSRKDNSDALLDGRTAEAYSDLYVADFDSINRLYSNPRKIDGPLNSKRNDGSFSYNPESKIGYTMKCNERKSNCIIKSAQYDENNKSWTETDPPAINSNEHSVGHPCINEKGDILYFVSDMQGGFGGKDIWKTTKKADGNWGLPINLGSNINTENDEMFPYVIGDTLIYFASDKPDGYGGLDIYFSHNKGLEFSQAVNLGYPYNSVSDDFGLILYDDMQGGLFTSNRNLETSDDIYSFDGLPFSITVRGVVTNKKNGEDINEAMLVFNNELNNDTLLTNEKGEYTYVRFSPYMLYKIQASKELFHTEEKTLEITDQDLIFSADGEYILNFELSPKVFPVTIKGKVTERGTGKIMPGERLSITGADQYSSFTYTNDEGIYEFKDLKPENTYTVKISKEGYFSESRSTSLPEVTEPMTFSKANGYDMDFELTKIEKKKEIVLNNIYYDFDKATLRPESKVELDKLASMLIETPEVVVQISSHTDARGPLEYNDRLSEARAESVVLYLISKGIDKDRLISKGYGERQLLIKNAKTEDEHQENRRTTFKVTDLVEVKKKTDEVAEEPEQSNLSFRVQLHSTQQPIPGHQLFKDILETIPNTHVFVHKANDFFKYEIGERASLDEIVEIKEKLKDLGYNDCFVTAWYNGEKISITKAKEILREK